MQLNGKQIIDSTINQSKLNLSYPITYDDAATKQYVDDFTVSGLTNSGITSPTDNDILTYSGGTWVNIAPVDGSNYYYSISGGTLYGKAIYDQGYTFSSDYEIVHKKYVDDSIGGLSTTLAGLTDTTITAPTEGELLIYTSGSWQNASTMNGNLTIIGDLYVSGTTTTIDVANLNIGDNIVLINSGETGAGVTLIDAGIEIDRGTLINYQFLFNETTETFRVGETGSLQAVATREDTPLDGGVAYWNSGLTRFDTSNELYWDDVNNRMAIGTNTPTQNLHIASSGNTRVVIDTSSSTSYSGIDFLTSIGLIGQFLATSPSFSSQTFKGDGTYLTNTTAEIGLIAYGANGSIKFNVGGATDANERMRITSTGTTSYNIIRYNSGNTFTDDDDIVNKLYIDNAILSGTSGLTYTLSGLTDTLIDTPLDTQLLRYNGSKWINSADYWTVDGNNLIPTNSSHNVQLSSIILEDDPGTISLIDFDITSGSTSGTENSYAFSVDGSDVMKIYSEADGLGGFVETAVVVEADYQYMGDPNTNGSWRFYVDDNNDLVFQTLIASVWTNTGIFSA